MCDNGYGLVKIRYFDEPVAGPTHIIKYTYIQSLLFLTSVTAGDEKKSSGRSPSLIEIEQASHFSEISSWTTTQVSTLLSVAQRVFKPSHQRLQQSFP